MFIILFLYLIYLVIFSTQDGVLSTGESVCEDALLEGHLGIMRELLAFMTPEKKFQIGAKKDGCNLIKVRKNKEIILQRDIVETGALVWARSEVLSSLSVYINTYTMANC